MLLYMPEMVQYRVSSVEWRLVDGRGSWLSVIRYWLLRVGCRVSAACRMVVAGWAKCWQGNVASLARKPTRHIRPVATSFGGDTYHSIVSPPTPCHGANLTHYLRGPTLRSGRPNPQRVSLASRRPNGVLGREVSQRPQNTRAVGDSRSFGQARGTRVIGRGNGLVVISLGPEPRDAERVRFERNVLTDYRAHFESTNALLLDTLTIGMTGAAREPMPIRSLQIHR